MFKKLAVLAAALVVSVPALADNGYHRGHWKGQRHFVAQRPVVHYHPVVVHRPAVVHHYYRPAPRPVYVVQQHNHVNPAAVIAGALIGAVIVHQIATNY